MRRRWQKLPVDEQRELFPGSFESSYYKKPKARPVQIQWRIAEIYCPNEDCACRWSEVGMRLLGPSYPKQPDDDEWFCPHCKTRAKFMGSYEPAEYRKLYGEFRDITQIEEDDALTQHKPSV